MAFTRDYFGFHGTDIISVVDLGFPKRAGQSITLPLFFQKLQPAKALVFKRKVYLFFSRYICVGVFDHVI